MMLHRHFEAEKEKNMTTLADLNKKEEFVSNIFPNDENAEQPKRGRRKKSED